MKAKNNYKAYGSTATEQLKNMYATIKELKQHSEFNHNSNMKSLDLAQSLIESRSTAVYKEQIQERTEDPKASKKEVKFCKKVLKTTKLIRKTFKIPSSKTFFVKNPQGKMVFCIKL